MATDRNGWWAERWLAYANQALLPAAMTEGQARSAQRAGARITYTRGMLQAHVAVGQFGREAVATVRVKPLAEREWRRVLDAIEADADCAHRLLRGHPGVELERAFAAAGVALFPAGEQRRAARCTCRATDGCRHLNALVMSCAVQLEENPFLWLEVLGKPRAELLAQVAARLREGAAREADGTESSVLLADHFWTTDIDPTEIPIHFGTGSPPVLRQLGALPLPPELSEVTIHGHREVGEGAVRLSVPTLVQQPVTELLDQFATTISRFATELALGDRPPLYTPDPLPGKPLPPARG